MTASGIARLPIPYAGSTSGWSDAGGEIAPLPFASRTPSCEHRTPTTQSKIQNPKSKIRNPRVLLIRLSAIGDVVVTTPVSRAIREAIPDAYVAWVVEPKAREVVEGNPYLDEVIVWDRGRGGSLGAQLAAYRRLRRELRGPESTPRFTVAIDFQGLLRSGLMALLSGARLRIGNTGCKEPVEWLYTARVPRPTDTRSSRQRCLDLLRPLGIESRDRRGVFPVTEEHFRSALATAEQAGLPPGARYACLAPMTTWPQKHWLPERWAVVADRLRAEHGLTSLFLGGPGDRENVAAICGQMAGPAVNLCGRTTLKEAGALLSGAAVVAAVDTGLLHIAAAVGAPLVGVCGASYWPGFQDYDDFRLVRVTFPCSPCLHHPICRNTDCMQALAPDRVLAACRELLAPGELRVVPESASPPAPLHTLRGEG